LNENKKTKTRPRRLCNIVLQTFKEYNICTYVHTRTRTNVIIIQILLYVPIPIRDKFTRVICTLIFFYCDILYFILQKYNGTPVTRVTSVTDQIRARARVCVGGGGERFSFLPVIQP